MKFTTFVAAAMLALVAFAFLVTAFLKLKLPDSHGSPRHFHGWRLGGLKFFASHWYPDGRRFTLATWHNPKHLCWLWFAEFFLSQDCRWPRITRYATGGQPKIYLSAWRLNLLICWQPEGWYSSPSERRVYQMLGLKSVALWGALAIALMAPLTLPTVAYAQDAITTSADAQAAPDPGDVTAPPDNTWTIPYGSMIDGGAQVITSVLLMFVSGILAYAGKFLPGIAGTIYRNFLMKQAEQLLARAVEYGINATKGATKGAKLDINVGSSVIANAAEYATASGWKFLVDWLGGMEGIKQKVFARVDLEPNATPEQVGVTRVRIPAVMARS